MFEHLMSRIVGSGLGDAAADALSSAAIDVLVEQVQPLVVTYVAALREQLIERLTGDPPATYAAELAKLGLTLPDDRAVRAVWGATMRAIAGERVKTAGAQ